MKTEQTTCLIRSIIAVFITLLSTGLGFFGGLLAELPYSMEGPSRGGWIAGVISGLIVGIIYCIFAIYQLLKGPGRKRFIIYGTSAGIAAGVISAATAHFTLMTVYPPLPIILVIGLACGVAAGATLGLIGSALFAATIKETTPQIIPEQNNDQ